MTSIEILPLSKLFKVKTGDFHATKELELGDIPLVSCGDTNNGVIGSYAIPQHLTYERCLTVAYNGMPLLTKFHPYRFGAKDDVGILIPKEKLDERTLLYIAAMLSRNTWRYSYGRKCFKAKIPLVTIPIPVNTDGHIDESWIENISTRGFSSYVPPKAVGGVDVPDITWQRFPLESLFTFDHGDFNSYGEFPNGKELIVSRSADHNGVAGHYEPPEYARKFPIGIITVSTVTGDAFVQLHEFYASDKVVLCIPKIKMRPETLFFIAFAINYQRWRYSYGHSCFKRTLSLISIDLPSTPDKIIDENVMDQIIDQTSYWSTLSKCFS